jgi:shikimate kinase
MAIPLPLSERNLILTGYTGPNQPALSRLVGERLRMPVVNVESLIAERVGLSIEEIRSYYGETRLKSIQSEIVDETALRRNTVIRIGASTLLQGDALPRLRQTGPVICLVTTLDAMLQRLHIAMGARYYNPQERAAELSALRREWSVRGLDDVYEINTTYLDVEAIVERVVTLWQDIAIERR